MYMKHDRALPKTTAAAASCCQALPIPIPPPKETLSSLLAKMWSLNEIHVFLMRGLENFSPWPGVFYQALLQPSIICILHKGCGG